MSYSLKRKNNYKILYSYKEMGFVVKPSFGASKYKISVSKITLEDNDLIKHYISKTINKKFNNLFSKMYRVLTEEEEDPSETPLILDEIAKLKSIVITKYKDYVSEEVYKEILKKLLIAEDEFKKNYNEKLFYRSVVSNSYASEFEESRGKSR